MESESSRIRDIDTEFMQRYIGGTIIVPTYEKSDMLIKGEITGARVEGTKLVVRLIAREKTRSSLRELDKAIWKQMNLSTHKVAIGLTAHMDARRTLTFMPEAHGVVAYVYHP